MSRINTQNLGFADPHANPIGRVLNRGAGGPSTERVGSLEGRVFQQIRTQPQLNRLTSDSSLPAPQMIHQQSVAPNERYSRLVQEASRLAEVVARRQQRDEVVMSGALGAGGLPPSEIARQLIDPPLVSLPRIDPPLVSLPRLDIWTLIPIKCHCHKLGKIVAIALFALTAISAAGLVVSAFSFAFLPAALASTAVAVSAVAFGVIGGLALIELLRRNRRLQAPLQEAIDKVHAFVVRSLCSVVTAAQEKHCRFRQVYNRSYHPA